MADVLFVCVHNAGRSQMAKALFNHLAQQRGLPFRALAAGTEPATRLHPEVVQVMAEVGLDLSGERPQLLTDALVRGARRVVVMGCAVDAQACPALLLKEVEDWGLPDPKGRPLPEVRAIREAIRQKVEALLTALEREGVASTA
ncbi:MAG: arsenate reductase ArsC [Dehalococcoidia bacterium]|nr:arsenate reductase ArsC [Dehalococcoidia bacterium]MDW8119918.1 arsenate reductase ArsC [Chloroflexota bacterium]